MTTNQREARTGFGKNSKLRISASPKRPETSFFNVPALPPNIVPGQVDVLPAQRRQVSQHTLVGQLASFAQGLRRPIKVHGIPQHDGGRYGCIWVPSRAIFNSRFW